MAFNRCILYFLFTEIQLRKKGTSNHACLQLSLEPNTRVRLRDGSSIKYGSDDEGHKRPGKDTRRRMLVTFFDIFVQVLQLTFFLVTFSVITHHIIHSGSSRVSLKDLHKTMTYAKQ